MKLRGSFGTALSVCAGVALSSGCQQSDGTTQVPFTLDINVDGADDNNDPDSDDSQMCVNELGETYVLWLDDRLDRDGKQTIWMNRAVGQPWLEDSWLPAPIRVNQGDGNVWDPQIYCNDLGAFVVWEDDRDGLLENHQIYFNRTSDKGESFLPEDILLEPGDDDGNSMSLGPRITGTGQDLFVTWYDGLNGAYDILVTSSGDAGATWRDPTRVDADNAGAAYSGVPKMAVSESATDAWVVWEESRNGASDIYFARSDTGGISFEEDERIDEGDEAGEADSFSPQVCADDEMVYVVWHDARNGEGRDIFMNYSADRGESWGVAAQRLDVDTAGLGNSINPACVATGTTLHVVWQDNGEDNSGYDILYRQVKDGLPSLAPVRLDMGDGSVLNPPGSSNSLEPRIALAPDTGNIVVLWRDGRAEAAANLSNGYDDLYYNYSQGGGPFQPNDFRVDSYYDGSSFKLDHNVSALGGRWYASWSDGRDGTSDIFFQSMAVGTAADPPSLSDLQ